MLYRKTEVYSFGKEKETSVRIVDINPDEALSQVSNSYCSISFKKATKKNTTIGELVMAIESELERENHHSEADLPAFIVKHVSKVSGPGAALDVLWNMIKEKGLMLGL